MAPTETSQPTKNTGTRSKYLRERIGVVVGGLMQASNLSTLIKMIRLRLDRRLPAGMRLPDGRLSLNVRALDGGEVFIRPRTKDYEVVCQNYSTGFHHPPDEIKGEDLKVIFELGCNIGVALAWYCHRYPNATVVGVEPDPGNVEMSIANTARFGDRCKVIQAGVWSETTRLTVSGDIEHGMVVRPAEEGDADTIDAISIKDIVEREAPEGEDVDYMMITVEGSEREVFKGDRSWSERVRSLRIERNPQLGGPSPQEVEQWIGELGYRAWEDPTLAGCTMGVKP